MTERGRSDHAAVAERLKQVRRIEEVLKQVGRQAEREHALAGRRIPMWRDGKIAWEVPQVENGHAGST